jgi:hypothetical protein
LRAADPAAISVFSGGLQVSIGNQSSIAAIIDAPIATVIVGSRVNGCVGGAEIDVAPDAMIASTNPNATLPLQP